MLLGIIIGFLGGILLFIWMDSTPRRLREEEGAPSLPRQEMPGDVSWEELSARAELIVEETIAELPADIAAEARAVPCLLQEHHPTRKRVLGIYVNTGSVDLSARKGPIVLYLRTIENYCRQCRLQFDDQVRATYLHELGHHVGWNEGQVQERGL
jgi:predicted Zn-dependent protease with MMP-like domain